MSGRDQADVRRIVILIALGIAVNVSAMLYVSNGSADLFTWTYQECVQYQPEVRIGHRCCLSVPVCARWEPQTRPWVYTWLSESAVTSAFVALAASLTIRPGVVSR